MNYLFITKHCHVTISKQNITRYLFFTLWIQILHHSITLHARVKNKTHYSLEVLYHAKIATATIENLNVNNAINTGGTITGFIGAPPSIVTLDILLTNADQDDDFNILPRPSIAIANTTTTLIISTRGAVSGQIPIPLITFPSHPYNGQKITIINEYTNQTSNILIITSIVTPNATIIGSPSYIGHGDTVSFMYYAKTNTWYRI